MKIAVCDDEKIFRDIITGYLQPYKANNPNMSETEFACGEDLVAAYERGERFDLILLDVEMKGLSGVEAAKQIRALDDTVMIVFITSHTKYVPEAFILSAFQFLVKPVGQEMFNTEFERAMRTYKKMKYRYSISYQGELSVLEVKGIFYVETYNRHMRAATSSGSFEYTGKITTEEKKLTELDFVRCHKGYLVNMHHIYRVDNDEFELTHKERIPISKHFRNNALAAYNKYVSGCCV